MEPKSQKMTQNHENDTKKPQEKNTTKNCSRSGTGPSSRGGMSEAHLMRRGRAQPCLNGVLNQTGALL